MNLKKELKKFMNSQNSDMIIDEITEAKVQDYDGEEGFIGENYIVEYKGRKNFYTLIGPDSIKKEGTALVNRKQFRNWHDKISAVKYL